MEKNDKPIVIQLHPEEATSEAIAKMCDPQNVSIHIVPRDLSKVPGAIAEILKNRPRTAGDVEQTWGRGW